MENRADSEVDRVKRLLHEISELIEHIATLTDERQTKPASRLTSKAAHAMW